MQMEVKRLRVKFKEYEMLDGSRRTLVQQVGDGSVIKRFEMTPVPRQPQDIVCPHFLELKWAYGCPYSCAWCYLQGTLRMLPTKTKPVFKSYGKIASNINAFLESDSPPEILNTGEIADSLMGEHLTPPFSRWITERFVGTPHEVLFLSKGINIRKILDLPSSLAEKSLFSWSLNAVPVAERWERGAPSVLNRIQAAYDVASRSDCRVRARIDPMVPIESWRDHYIALIDMLMNTFFPERITFGSLRGLQSTINNARDKSWVKFLSEPSGWGRKIKFSIRYEMYSTVIEHLRKTYGYNRVALCKEPVAMWNELGLDYRNCKCNCVW